jgi:plastocyanin
MERRTYLAFIGSVVMVASWLALSEPTITLGARLSSTEAVSAVNYTYQPNPVQVLAGATVTWTNNQTNPATSHTVTADDGSFDSGTLFPAQMFSMTFNTIGQFNYHCSFHQSLGMIGTIDVFAANCPNWDVNCDHIANINDLIMVGQFWQQTGPPSWVREDVNGDGVVNINDLIVVGQHWQQTW